MKTDDPYQPCYDPTHNPPPRSAFLAIWLVIAFWLALVALAFLVFG
jgi:hypothetical protein